MFIPKAGQEANDDRFCRHVKNVFKFSIFGTKIYLLVEVFLCEGVAELLNDAFHGLGDSEIANSVTRVHALLKSQHFGKQGVQW